VYVADAGNDQIDKLSPQGQVIATFGSYGSDPGKFNYPSGIALDGAGNIYVADEENHRIQKLSPSGDPIAQWGEEGLTLGQLRGPNGIALGPDGTIYVSDWGDADFTDRVIKISPSGQFLAQWGGAQGNALGQFNTPADITQDGRGDLFVAEGGVPRIQELSATDGRPLASIGTQGSGPGQFDFGDPTGLVADGHGNLYVVEEDQHRIERYNLGG
jgi:DNA-binding beta-propeller fold protein YncE